jgi:osmotically-inducible protein OsmY
MNSMTLRAAGRGAAVTLLLVLTGGALAESPPDQSASQAVKDAWIDGRLETTYALNPYLNSFDIDTRVENGKVYLAGALETDIDRDLAVEIARAIDGVTGVESTLAVDPGSMRAEPVKDSTEKRSFAQWVQDATTTARVKSSLVANGNTKSLAIDVTTHYDVVTLSGDVGSRKNKMLAEMIARNTEGIASVKNKLEYDEPT